MIIHALHGLIWNYGHLNLGVYPFSLKNPLHRRSGRGLKKFGRHIRYPSTSYAYDVTCIFAIHAFMYASPYHVYHGNVYQK